MRALEAIHEGVARNFGAALSSFLRTIIEVRVATAEQLTYSEFIHSLPNPTCFNLVSAPPLEGQMCLGRTAGRDEIELVGKRVQRDDE